MPEVSGPSDGGYNYYQKKLSDLEDEIRTDAKKSEKRERERVDDLGRKYDADRARMEENLRDTVKQVKADSQEQINRDHEYNKGEVNRIKSDTYDRFGRSHGLEADVLRAQLQDQQRASDSRYRKDDDAIRDAQNAYSTKMEEANKDFEERLDQGVQNAHDSAMEHYDRAFGEERDQYLQFKKDAEANTNALDKRRMEDLSTERRRYESALAESKRDFDHRLSRANQTNDTRYHLTERQLQKDQENQTRALNQSHANETAVLREQIHDLDDADARYQRERGQGMKDAVNEYENDWRSREDAVTDTYTQEIDKLKRDNDELAHQYASQNDRNLREKDQYFTKVINRQNTEHHLEKKDIQDTFMRDREQLNLRHNKDNLQAEKNLESRLTDANLTMADALEKQAIAYQDTINRNRESDATRIKTLEKSLQTATTSEDTNVISPAAEAAVRKSVVNQYEKTQAQDQVRNRDTIDSIQRAYVQRMQDAIAVEQAKTTNVAREAAHAQSEDRAKFLEHAKEADYMHQTDTLNREASHDKESDNMTRGYSSMLMRQRQEFDNMLSASRDDSATKIAALRQQADFDLKMAQRSFNVQQNELIRGYDKKLADQKADYESRLENLKTSTAQDLREGERKNRMALEEMQRSYEQRLTQVEQQHKERERYLTQNSEEELEKVRRSNALLIQKKS